MQILIPDSWLRDYLETEATPKQIQEALSLCGPSIERLNKVGDDYVYDIEVTTNRVDRMSVIGIAFECVAILPRFGYKAKLKIDPYAQDMKLNTQKKVEYLEVKLDKELCFRFSAVLIKNVKLSASPDWMVKRLESAGLRSLNNVVDISNYLMIEMGQPVHTFDYDKISGSKMVLRESIKGEKITTLDKKEHELPGGDIIIEDGSGTVIDLCGIMGGFNSAVNTNTKNVLLFVQVYEPVHIRKTSMSLAHRTGAAVLFEKGLPVENVLPTLQKGIELFSTLTGGIAENNVLDVLNVVEGNSPLKLKSPITKLAQSRLGIDINFQEISKILKSLEFKVVSETEVEIPWVRKTDITISEDLVEEIARIYGYHNIPSVLMSGSLPTNRPNDNEFYWVSKIKSALKYWGFTELYTYSLTAEGSGLKLKSPLSTEWTYLRTNLADSHKIIVSENLGKAVELNFFEIANVYLPKSKSLPDEKLHLVLSTTNKNFDKFKGVITTLLNIDSAVIVEYPECLIFETDLSDYISKASNINKFIPISKFSPIIEDFNITLTSNYSKLKNSLKKLSPLINQIELIDKFGKKITLRITFADPNSQLSKEDIAPLRELITSGKF